MIPSSLLAPPERRALPDWLTLEVAQVSGTVVRSVFFGLFVVLISILIYVLLSKRYGTSASVERYMFVTTSILFLIAFIDWVVDLCRTIEALERFSKSGPLGRIFLRRAAEPTFIIRVLTFALQNAIGELFMIYRVYIVWQRNKWIILPPIFLCGAAFATNIGSLKLVISMRSIGIDKRNLVEVWFTIAVVLSFLTNALCTILITIVIFKTERLARSAGLPSSTICQMTRFTVDSGAILCFSLGFGAFSYFISPNFQTISSGMTVPIVGITWTLILVRVVRAGNMKEVNSRFHSQTTSDFATLTIPQITTADLTVPKPLLSSFV